MFNRFTRRGFFGLLYAAPILVHAKPVTNPETRLVKLMRKDPVIAPLMRPNV